MKSKGHTLWLVPTGDSFKKFRSLIEKLAKEYRAPAFQPHVTLLGEITRPEEECVRLTKQLVSGQKPLEIEMGQVDYQDFYFRTLFVKVKKTEPLLALYARAKEVFQMNDIPLYMPHLSILYGTFPEPLKKEIIKEIGRDQSCKFEINSVHLMKGGAVKDWQIIGEYPLAG